MKEKLGIGIVGLGWVSSQYIRSFRRNRYCEIRAVCVRDRARGQQVLKEYDLEACRVYVNVDELCEQRDIDIVCILTPNYLHTRQAMRYAEAGKNLIIEKPVALNLTEARMLNESTEQRGNCFAPMIRCTPTFTISISMETGAL